MVSDFHFLRPWWLLAVIPLLGLLWVLLQKNPQLLAWSKICDAHLLPHLVKNRRQGKRHSALLFLFLSGLFICLSLAGPSWLRLPVPAYQAVQPRVLILDMSSNMLDSDLTPNRLTRAKFKLHDLFTQRDAGQFALVAFTGEPFVVSPLTDDGKTIDSLLQSLTPQIMPVGGQKLDSALEEGAQLITQAGFNQGQLLVLTATPPDEGALSIAEKLAEKGIFTSIMPIMADKTLASLFQPLATAGKGLLISFSDTSKDLDQWLKVTNTKQSYAFNEHNDIPVWRDEGRWLLIPALIFLLPVFRRGWLQRIDS